MLSSESKELNISDLDVITNRFGPKKIDSLKLADIYSRLGLLSRAERVSHCGEFLEFAHMYDYETGLFTNIGKLINANFCRDLLCPTCQWRKSLKQVSVLSRVLNDESIKGHYRFLMITFTVPNVNYDDLNKGIDKLYSGFDRLMHKKKYKSVIKGYFKSLEVTINQYKNTFHPHLHVLVLVPLSYKPSYKSYISHDELLNDWRDSCRDQSITQVDIRLAYLKNSKSEKFTLESAALEICKYAAKVPSYLYTDEIIYFLINGLSHRRTVSFGGVIKDTLKLLKLEDFENLDLVNIDDVVPDPVMTLIIKYGWTPSGYQISSAFINGGNLFEDRKVS